MVLVYIVQAMALSCLFDCTREVGKQTTLGHSPKFGK